MKRLTFCHVVRYIRCWFIKKSVSDEIIWASERATVTSGGAATTSRRQVEEKTTRKGQNVWCLLLL